MSDRLWYVNESVVTYFSRSKRKRCDVQRNMVNGAAYENALAVFNAAVALYFDAERGTMFEREEGLRHYWITEERADRTITHSFLLNIDLSAEAVRDAGSAAEAGR